MKLFRIIIMFPLVMICFYQAVAQDTAMLSRYIKDSGNAVHQRKFRDVQASLQMALNAVNAILGKELLASLPLTLDGLKADTADDIDGTGVPEGSPGIGMMVSREYTGPNDKSATLSIMKNSDAATSANMIIANPSMIEASDEGDKIVSVGAYKAILSWDSEEKTGDLQIPIGKSIISINSDGFENGNAVVAFAEKIDIAKIKKLLGEQ